MRPIPLAAALALAAAGTAPAQTVAPDQPPPAVPQGATFNVAAVTFSTANLSFATAAMSFGTVAATLPGAATDLGAAAIDLPGVGVREEAGGLRFTLGADVLFDFDKFALRPEAGPILRKLVAEVRAKVPSARWQVEGHTDAKGSDAYNDRLSDRRAGSVRTWLTTSGAVPATDISTVGFGERRPVAPNTKPDGSDDPDGRQRNRRVEILVTPP